MVADVELLKRNITDLPEPLPRVALIVVSGLPGTGKSHFSRRLVERVPVVIVESDAMRKILAPSPTYSSSESGRLFKACHALIEDLLVGGVSVLFDATNLIERNRERLYNIAHKTSAKLIIVRTLAPLDMVSDRLRQRHERPDQEDNSDADISVYHRMASTDEPIRRNYFSVDTSRDIAPAIEKVAREIQRWLKS